MRIANPMYDVVFKHLLEDLSAASLIIGTILGEDIEDIAVLPQENTVERPRSGAPPRDIRLQRIDFAATLRTAGGERMRVLIEVQKAHDADDIMRFRRYLGRHYADDSAIEVHAATGRRPLKLLAIYFLGRPLPHTEATVLKVTRQYLDAVTGELLIRREEFVEALSHDCYVVQASRLADRRRNDLEKLLSVFDQTLCTADRHVLEIDESAMPGDYRPVLRRLEAAAASLDVAESMRFEDEVEEAWGGMERKVAESQEAVAERDQTIAERDQTIAERDQTIAERDEALAESKEALAESKEALVESKEALVERDRTIAALEESVRRLTASDSSAPGSGA